MGIIDTSPATTLRSTAIIISVMTAKAERKLENRSERSVFWIAFTSGMAPVESEVTPRAWPPCAATIGSIRARTVARKSP